MAGPKIYTCGIQTFFFNLGFTTRQNYFTNFEPSQSQGRAKTGDPPGKPLNHPQAELGLSHMWPELGLNPQGWDDVRFRALKISSLNHSATEAQLQFLWNIAIGVCVNMYGRVRYMYDT